MQHDFDDFAISLAKGQSRRGTLKQLLLGAIGVPAVVLGGVGKSEAEAQGNGAMIGGGAKKKKHRKKHKNNKNRNRDHKKVTLCQNGQTIKVNKKSKKKFLRQGATPGACQDTPACVPDANPCAGRVCGSVDNGCGAEVACGECTLPDICDNNTGQCGCTPTQNPCGDRVCGTVDNGCGEQVPCGTCTPPETCDNGSGQCVCIPIDNPCGDRICGSVDNGCGTAVQCGENSGDCPAAPVCNSAGICGNDGQCTYAIADADIGSPCGQDDAGICVKTGDGSGSCVLANNGSESCIGADPCGEVNPPRQCAESNPWGQGDCGCYSTTEEGGICLRRVTSGPNAFTYPYSAVGCFGTGTRPGCNVSSDCAAGSVCAPLDELGTAEGTCCPGYEGFRGACIQVATDICTAPLPN